MSAPILSVLAPSPVFEGRTPRQALEEPRALAVATDARGDRSYWVQEHHTTPGFAGTAPEILIADLAARTRNLVIGSGGVLLPNYSPLKVAEQFMTLSALYPDRVELGIGRATGADQRTSAALLGPGPKACPQMMRYLMDWLRDASGHTPMPDDHRAAGVRANPGAALPDLWQLASSPESAAFAGAMGIKLAFADFLSAGPAMPAIAAYRQAFKPSPFLEEPHAAIGLVALAAETDEEARHLSRTSVAWNIGRASGQFLPFPTPSEADAAIASATPGLLERARGRSTVGAAASVAERLSGYAKASHADELFVLTISETLEARIKSYDLLAKAFAAA